MSESSFQKLNIKNGIKVLEYSGADRLNIKEVEEHSGEHVG